MKIAQLLAPVHSLGPGNRIALWTQGCSKECFGCISPEFQPHSGKNIKEIELAELLILTANKTNCTGITISGGDPFEQSPALLELLKRIRPRFSDILVYTGFTLEEINNTDVKGKMCLGYIDVLIDGVYIDDLNDNKSVLRGSTNQKIYFFNTKLKDTYNNYMKNGRIIEVFNHDSKIITTGILNRSNCDE